MASETLTFVSRNLTPEYTSIRNFFRGGTGRTIKKEKMVEWMPVFVADVNENTEHLIRTAERLDRMAEKEKRRREALKALFKSLSGLFGRIGLGGFG